AAVADPANGDGGAGGQRRDEGRTGRIQVAFRCLRQGANSGVGGADGGGHRGGRIGFAGGEGVFSQRVTGRAGGQRGRAVGLPRAGDPVADDEDEDRAAVALDARQGDRVFVARVAPTAVGDRAQVGRRRELRKERHRHRRGGGPEAVTAIGA